MNVRRHTNLGHMLGLVLLAGMAFSARAESTYHPMVKPSSGEGEKAIKRFTVADGLKVELWAEEPMLANPVCLFVDYKGRVYVAETFRHHAGVTDMRQHTKWLDDDLAARSVEDRRKSLQKNLGLLYEMYGLAHDRIRLIEDTDGDGKADKATVFADGFHSTVDGIGAGILADGDDVYFTCIPNLWKLRDTNGDGVADQRTALSTGWGCHSGFLGHDMHGLIKGPDGMLYWSIGDRGFNVTTPEGKHLFDPDRGAVLRCNPDGSGLEVVHTGLRNPQELAFDDYGNLFTGDNNSDGGDKARWVYITEGGDSGWCYGFQWFKDPTPRGAWNAEKMWHPLSEAPNQPAFLVPPIINLAAGPSGLAFDPGTGLGDHYRNRFLLCDFRGSAPISIIHSFTLTPKGATFDLTDREDFLRGSLVTDATFGLNGVYVTDWTEGWDQPRKGRIYRIFDPSLEHDPKIAEVRKLLGEGMKNRSLDALAALLHHADRRVRLEAQFELASRGADSTKTLQGVLGFSESRLARLHALWALGQIRRAGGTVDDKVFLALLSDPDVEVCNQGTKLIGDLKITSGLSNLIGMLKDTDARGRYFAAQSLAKVGTPEAVTALLAMLAANNNSDPYLRHAGTHALGAIGDADALLARADDLIPAVRMAVLLSLRRMGRAEVARFLHDADPLIAAEAARAINDVPIAAAMPELAALVNDPPIPGPSENPEDTNLPILLRAINASLRVGGLEQAQAVAYLAVNSAVIERARLEALWALKDWAEPSGRDRILGVWRPLPKRDPSIARKASAPVIGAALKSESAKVQLAAVELAESVKLAEAGAPLLALLKDDSAGSALRGKALHALGEMNHPLLSEAVEYARHSTEGRIRSESNAQLARLNPDQAVRILTEALDTGSIGEQQAAISTLAAITGPSVEGLLGTWLDKLNAGHAPAEIELNLLDAAVIHNSPAIQARVEARKAKLDPNDTLSDHREALVGGSAERGETIFFNKNEVTCQKCHAIGKRGGGEVGPNLSDVGLRKDRRYILESILHPNAQIAPGYENITVTMKSGDEYAGRVLSETPETIELEVKPEAEGPEFIEEENDPTRPAPKPTPKPAIPTPTPKPVVVKIAKSDITDRTKNLSSMPDDISEELTRAEMRDLVEYLSNQKEKPATP